MLKKTQPFQGRPLESFSSHLKHFSSWRLPWLSYILILIHPGGLGNAFRNISRPHLAAQLTLRNQSGSFWENDFVPLHFKKIWSISVCAHWAISWGHMILSSKHAQKDSTFSGKASAVFFKSQTHNLKHFSSWRLPWLSYILILIHPGGLGNAFRNISRPHLAAQLTLRNHSGNFCKNDSMSYSLSNKNEQGFRPSPSGKKIMGEIFSKVDCI